VTIVAASRVVKQADILTIVARLHEGGQDPASFWMSIGAPLRGERLASRRLLSLLPIAVALGYVTLFGQGLFSLSWPFVDIHNTISNAATSSWRQYVANAFGRDVEYRPLFTLGVKLSYELVGLRLWFYQALVLLQFGAVLALVLWLFRPVGVRRAVAASIALASLAALHTTRILFGFWPLNHHSAGLVLLLVALVLALDPRTRAFDWIFFPLTFVALLVLESGLLLAPLVPILWWIKAPGVSLRGVAGTLIGVACYVAIRFTFGATDTLSSIYTGSGLGFSQLSPEALRNIFEHAPWLFWLYNVCASLLTVLASEPRAGVYQFVASLLRGETPFWQWFHVGSSLLTTLVVVAGLIVYRPSGRDRQLVVSGLVLVVCGSALGALYTRDRIGLSAGVGYVLLLYVALSAILERLPASFGWRRPLVTCGVGVVAIAWFLRSAETYIQFRDTAWDFHLEWTDRYADLGGAAQPQTELLTSLRSAALSATPADPRLDPAWTYALFERRFRPGDRSSRVSPDAAADNAVLPLSPPFDVRWKPDVDDAGRVRLEAELGLADALRVERDPTGRTWAYRLRRPTRDRVRTVLKNAAVEDTARIDAARFQIVE
jgi:hypothetical protein